MKTTENNKIIAEFMGLKPKCELDGVYSFSDLPFFSIRENDIDKVVEGIAKYAKYHSNWNWLMEVVEKIKQVKPLTEINISLVGTKIKSFDFEDGAGFSFFPKVNTQEKTMLIVTYNAVLEFIKWYNEQKA